MRAGLGIETRNRAEEIFHNVRKVDADIEQDAALVFHVPPDRNEHFVVTTHGVVDHQAWLADSVRFDQGFDQSIDRVTAVILGHADDQFVRIGRVLDNVRGFHCQTDWLFDHHMHVVAQRLQGQ